MIELGLSESFLTTQNTILRSALDNCLRLVEESLNVGAAAAIPTGRAPDRSRGFWNDLVVSEQGTVALDRVQIVVWTLILGGIFLWAAKWWTEARRDLR